MSPEIRGITAVFTGSLRSIAGKLDEDAALARNLVIREQIYSEFTHARVGEQARAPEPRFENRMNEVYSDDRIGTRLGDFDGLYWLVDLQRLDREWLVDWNGLDRDSPDSRAAALTFAYRAAEEGGDYQEAVIERVVEAFEDADPRPTSIVIGAEMERHYAAAPEDWPAFAAFVRDISAGLRAVDPNVRLAVGINWSNFMDEIVPRFVSAAGQTEANFQALRAAWEAVIDPLYLRYTDEAAGVFETALDFYAFAAVPDVERYPSPRDLAATHFSGIPTFFAEYPEKQLSVAWVSVGWPVNSPSSDFFGTYYEAFARTAGGYDIELVSWWGYGHLLSDSDCRTMTQTIGLPSASCYEGLYTSSGSPVSGLRDDYFTDGVLE